MKNNIKSSVAALVVVTASVFAQSSSASTITLTFDSRSDIALGPATYSESGYTVSVMSGDEFAIDETSALAIGANMPTTAGDAFALTRDDGAVFTLDGFDFAALSAAISDGIVIQGFLNNALVGGIDDISSARTSFTPANVFGLTDPVDTLLFVAMYPGDTALLIDNVTLSTVPVAVVPLPATLPLLLLGLGIGGVGRRHISA